MSVQLAAGGLAPSRFAMTMNRMEAVDERRCTKVEHLSKVSADRAANQHRRTNPKCQRCRAGMAFLAYVCLDGLYGPGRYHWHVGHAFKARIGRRS